MNRFMNPNLLGQPAQPFRQVSPLQALLGGGEQMVEQAMPQQAMQPAMNPRQNRMSGFREMLPDIMIGLGAGLASGNPGVTAQIYQQQLADGRERKQQDRSRNATLQWMRGQAAKNPMMAELIGLVEAGALTPTDAFKMAMQKSEQPTPFTDIGKARRDLDSGYITQQQFDRLAQPAPGYRLLTPQEEQQYGLPPDGVYQKGADGKISAIGGGGVTVNNDLRGENKFDETLGKELATDYLTMQKEGVTARNAIATLDQMKALAAEPGFYSGAGGESVLAAKRLGQAVGINPEGIDSMETFNALSKQSALAVMGGSLGAGFSNADRDFVLGQVPNLGNTPEGNVRLIEVQKRLAQRKVQIQEFANQYARQNGGRLDSNFYIALEQWANSQPPIFSDMIGDGRQPMTANDLRNMTDQQLQEFINGR